MVILEELFFVGRQFRADCGALFWPASFNSLIQINRQPSLPVERPQLSPAWKSFFINTRLKPVVEAEAEAEAEAKLELAKWPKQEGRLQVPVCVSAEPATVRTS